MIVKQTLKLGKNKQPLFYYNIQLKRWEAPLSKTRNETHDKQRNFDYNIKTNESKLDNTIVARSLSNLLGLQESENNFCERLQS